MVKKRMTIFTRIAAVARSPQGKIQINWNDVNERLILMDLNHKETLKKIKLRTLEERRNRDDTVVSQGRMCYLEKKEVYKKMWDKDERKLVF